MAIQVKNCMEDFVIDLVKQVIKSYPDICTCDQCINDIVTWSLNHLPARYVNTNIGDAYTRLDIYKQEHYTDIIKIVVQAVEVVSKNPHHTKKDKQE
ncbi:late competence development ComFB family protein [Pectinatus cerevisiiphilus]|uniref:Competence protein ComFB n=1 Tax=Pectinatus cerevisiiphilus TaxID=86956 RepID=A0A4R3K5X7_9FIRM|nr:late competence development ComFB family protein [Pectinatus cerevisiiphilus]TCS78189.1 competence protein ComFB [Pectinatus cerevisiiphilus]